MVPASPELPSADLPAPTGHRDLDWGGLQLGFASLPVLMLGGGLNWPYAGPLSHRTFVSPGPGAQKPEVELCLSRLPGRVLPGGPGPPRSPASEARGSCSLSALAPGPPCPLRLQGPCVRVRACSQVPGGRELTDHPPRTALPPHCSPSTGPALLQGHPCHPPAGFSPLPGPRPPFAALPAALASVVRR